jgi:DNA-binding transcriptional LysR family regulator
VELRQLRYVIAVAEERNVTRAAERLGMQPPPLSRQIRAIEREIDAQLFRRKPRGVELTDAGRAFVDNARAVLAQVERTFETTRRTARGEQGRISIAYSSTVAFHPLIPRIIRAFSETFPLVGVAVIEGYPEDLVERMQRDEIDVAFVRRLSPTAQGIEHTLLHEESMMVALPCRHPLARDGSRNGVALKALAGESFVLIGDPNGDALQRNSAFAAACYAAGFSPQVGHVVPYISSRLNLIAAGLGVAVVAESLRHVAIEGVVFRSLTGAGRLKTPFGLASRRGDPSPVIRQFLKLARRIAASFSAGR